MNVPFRRGFIVSGLATLVVLTGFAMSATSAAARARSADGVPTGWVAAGDHPQDYAMVVDRSVVRSGHPSAKIAATASQPSGFGTLMQQIGASAFRGRRVRFSGDLLARDVSGWTALWMRVDGSNEMLAFDNAQERAMHGTADWQHFDVVLDVPEKAEGIAFGALLAGGGTVWVNGLKFEIVASTVPLTGRGSGGGRPSAPVNLDFAADTR